MTIAAFFGELFWILKASLIGCSAMTTKQNSPQNGAKIWFNHWRVSWKYFELSKLCIRVIYLEHFLSIGKTYQKTRL